MATPHEFDFNEDAKLIIDSATFSVGILVVRSFVYHSRVNIPFVQFKKREKHPQRSVTFSKVARFNLQLY